MGSNSPPESFIESCGGGGGIYTDTRICVAYLALPRPLFFTKIQDIDLYSKNNEYVNKSLEKYHIIEIMAFFLEVPIKY